MVRAHAERLFATATELFRLRNKSQKDHEGSITVAPEKCSNLGRHVELSDRAIGELLVSELA